MLPRPLGTCHQPERHGIGPSLNILGADTLFRLPRETRDSSILQKAHHSPASRHVGFIAISFAASAITACFGSPPPSSPMNIQLFQSVWNILMRIRRGWRDQAPNQNQNQNQNHQQQNGVARAGSDMMGSGSSQPDVVVVTNDLTDSDNWTAARLLQQLRREGKLNCKIVWIVEPRQVLFGVAISEADQLTCRGLIEKYFLQNMEKSSRPKESLKRLLRGSLTRDEIDNTVDDLDDRKMVSFLCQILATVLRHEVNVCTALQRHEAGSRNQGRCPASCETNGV